MKKLLRAGLVGVLFLLMSLPAFAVGVVKATLFENRENDLFILTLTWAAGGSGVVTAWPIPTPISDRIQGRYVVEVITVPGSAGAAPTTLYDITFIEPYGTDIMGGTLINRSATVTERGRPLPDPTKYSGLIPGILTFTLINNSNASATGTVYIFIKKTPTP